jgi:hypothetical protein
MRVQSQSNHPFPLAGACVSWIGLMTAWPTQAPPQSQDPCATNVTNSDWVCQVCAVVSLGTGWQALQVVDC